MKGRYCHGDYTDTNIYFTYHCDLEAGHEGPHENSTDGPGMRWFA